MNDGHVSHSAGDLTATQVGPAQIRGLGVLVHHSHAQRFATVIDPRAPGYFFIQLTTRHLADDGRISGRQPVWTFGLGALHVHTYTQPLAVPHCTWASGWKGHISSQAMGDGGGLGFVAALRGGGRDSNSTGTITDANNLSRFFCTNLSSSSFVGVVGGGGGGDVDSATTVPFTLGCPGFLSPASLFLEGPIRARR